MIKVEIQIDRYKHTRTFREGIHNIFREADSKDQVTSRFREAGSITQGIQAS